MDQLLSQISSQVEGSFSIEALRQPLLDSFERFSSLVIADADIKTNEFKARIVATRGSVGTKCPRWHADHVPIRWIQSLVGPGCDYLVGERGVNRELLNGILDDISTQDANKRIVDSSLASIRQGQEGEAVVLVGRDNSRGIPAAIHKSPTLLPWQGRVLLTIDVVT